MAMPVDTTDRVRPPRPPRRRGRDSCEWPEFAPPVGLSEGPLGEVQAADREIAKQTAIRARAVARFAASRPATADRAQGERGAMSAERWAGRPEVLQPVSEWAVQEMAVSLSISSEAAESLLVRSLTLVHRLPGTLAALEAGALHPGHLWTMLEKVAPIEKPKVRALVEAFLLRWAAGRVTTPAQLGAKARREVLRRDVGAAARKLERAIRERGVHLSPGPVEGTATVTAVLTLPEAQVFNKALGAYADAMEDDPDQPTRTRGQKMADCLLDLVLRPGEGEFASVQLLLTVVASVGTLVGGDEPGEIDNQVVPAEMVRDVIRRFVPRQPHTPATAVQQDEQDVTGQPAEPDQPDETGRPDAPGTVRAPVPVPGGDRAAVDPRPWQEVEQLELESWWAEMERRVLSGELGLGPDPLPDDLPVAASAGSGRQGPEQAPPPAHGWPGPEVGPEFGPDDGPRDPDIWLDRGWPGPEFAPDDGSRDPDIWLDQGWPEPESPPEPSPDAELPPERAPSDETGRWARADRAVDEASRALRRADQALAHARGQVRAAWLADVEDEETWQDGPGGQVTAAEDALGALAACSEEQREWLAELLITTGGGGLVERPRIALTDALSGTLLALTDLAEMRRVGTCGARACRRDPVRCTHDLTDRPALGPPGPTDGYRPAVPLDRWVRARDRRCRFPGCRRRVPRGGELDHDRPYPLGPTSATNLTGYCTGHHRGKHQAPGWQHELASDGTLTVTTPTGLTTVTTPAPY